MLVLLSIALAWDPSPEEQQLVRVLSSRDGALPCAELEALVPEPVRSLENIVEHVEMPPWAPMTAAACLVEHHAEDRPELLASWVTDPDKKGLARLVFNRLHLLEPERAEALVEAGSKGPYRADLRAALLRAPDPALRQRAATVPPASPE
ncbi:MAG: hypothetical protein R3F61_34490 [Myxococcota bacterium]